MASKCAYDSWLELQVWSWCKTWALRDKNSSTKSGIFKDFPVGRGKKRIGGRGIYLRGWSERLEEDSEDHSLLKTRPERVLRRVQLDK